jgi:hypothetical protein
MFFIPPWEHLIETKNCKKCSISFPITDTDIEFYSKVSPLFPSWGVSLQSSDGVDVPRKCQIPSPTLCLDCRQQRKLVWRNERKLYKRKCDATGKEMISMFSPNSSLTVYHPDAWHKHDFLSHWNEGYQFQETFFSEFWSLLKKVPQLWLSVAYNENCEYTNQCGNSKDCYYSFDVWMVEHGLYSNFIDDSSFLVDCSSTHESHHCYSCVDTLRCNQCQHLIRCSDCSFSTLLIDCIGCEYCSESTNLVNKKYYHRNKQYWEEEWLKLQGNNSKDEITFEDFCQSTPKKWGNFFTSTECSGDYISFSQKTFHSFETKDAQNVKYIDRSRILENSMDIRWFWNNLQFSYDSLSVGINAFHILFSMHCWTNVSDLIYCMYCTDGTKNCFGCIGLKGQEFCILNKQYTKEEYEILVPKIIEKMITDGEWWEFFPASLSPFGYNETVASEYFPLEKEEAQKQGFNWSDYEAPFPKVEKTIPWEKLPDDIASIPDDILNWAIECEVSKKLFRITIQELEFYRKHNIPIPRRHPDVRHMDRMKKRNPRKLWERKCDHCEKMMITTYAPERPETVYCESCYEREVIQ